MQHVVFRLSDAYYGIDIMQVNEIVKLQEITKLPNTPDYVEGIINLRGKVIPIVDLKVKFKLGRQERNDDTRIIVVNANNKIIGILVDEVSEVLRINDEQIDVSIDISLAINDDYVRGVAKVNDRLVILLNLEQIF